MLLQYSNKINLLTNNFIQCLNKMSLKIISAFNSLHVYNYYTLLLLLFYSHNNRKYVKIINVKVLKCINN